MAERRELDVNTHYFKIAHLNSLKFSVYSSSTNSDQTLLRLELNIRYNNPSILITYYNKCVYYFNLEGEEGEEGQNIQDAFKGGEFAWDLELKSSQTVSIESLTNVLKGNNGDEQLVFAGMAFLKAVKKNILFNLSRFKKVRLFGNYSVVNTNGINSILYLDPILLQSGDLLISVTVRRRLELYDTSALNLNPDSNFVVYLMPSGIRCHLFDDENFSKNFIKKRANADELLGVIKLSTGVDFIDQDGILWVKLTPNLRHLNNQTSKIAKFIHPVENKKFILWPWDLCLLQFGNYEDTTAAYIPEQSTDGNPFDVISELLNFKIANNQSSNSQPAPMSMSSIASTGLSSLPPSNGQKYANAIDSNEGPTMNDLFDVSQSESSQFFNTKSDSKPNENDEQLSKETLSNQQADNVDMDIKQLVEPKTNIEEMNVDKASNDSNDDMELDDLFGDGGNSEDSNLASNNEDTSNIKEEIANQNPIESKDGSNDNTSAAAEGEMSLERENLTRDNLGGDNFTGDNITENNLEALNDNQMDQKDYEEIKPTFLDIPPDQMTIKRSVTPNYSDPGAPLPIEPTPVMPTNYQSMPTATPASSSRNEKTPKSDFSPILFNPIIKSNIDAKYGKGGKFYVEKEEAKNKSLRATSVSGHDLRSKDQDTSRNMSLYQVFQESSPDSSNESDEDEVEMTTSPPLKLNTFNDSFISHPPNTYGPPTNTSEKTNNSIFSNNRIGPFASPALSSLPRFSKASDSPAIVGDSGNSYPPIEYELPSSRMSPPSNSEKEKPDKEVSESSNFLPLILRSVNVSTIPTFFLLNNLVNASLVPTFNIHDVDHESEFDTAKNNEMILKVKDLNISLHFLVPNLIFDFGLNNSKKNIKSVNNTESKVSLVDYEKADEEFESGFFKIFPYSYRVNLRELMNGQKVEEKDDIKDPLSFLENVTEKPQLTEEATFKEMNALEWNAFNLNQKNNENFDQYVKLASRLIQMIDVNSKSHFELSHSKLRANKNNTIVNLNSNAIEFWKYLNFSPIQGPKNFQVLMISESGSFNADLLSELIYSYSDCNLGKISRLNLTPGEARPDLESFHDGLLLLNKQNEQSYNDFYMQVDFRLTLLVELIKLDLMNKINGFEFDRPLLLLFINFNEELNSLIKISNIFKNFQKSLQDHQLPLVQIFTKVLPGSFFVKRAKKQSQLKILSNITLSKISMNLYNQCPDDLTKKQVTKSPFAQLLRDETNAINFKFMNPNTKDNSNLFLANDDLFLHLAYERSLDKNWISSAWSDSQGIVTLTKSWYCGSTNGHKGDNSSLLESISDEMWTLSTELFKNLSEKGDARSSGMGGKRFLVLTRINGIIPDDELVHWKRLSLKKKDVSLIVLSVNSMPKLIFSKPSSQNEISQDKSSVKEQDYRPSLMTQVLLLQNNSSLLQPEYLLDNKPIDAGSVRNYSVGSSPGISNFMASPPNSFQSPQQYFNVPGIFLSPQDAAAASASNNNANFVNPSLILSDYRSDIFAAIPDAPLPSFNSPTRLGLKIGYIMKELDSGDYLVFEVGLLSCSNYWSSSQLMKLILIHYKKLIVLNRILGLDDIHPGNADPKSDMRLHNDKLSTVPWHVAAVTKSLDYLVHINVED